MTWITPTDITPDDAGAWDDVDLSALVAAGTTGVACHVVMDNSADDFGWRKNGGTDNRVSSLYGAEGPTHCWFFCGVDASRILEIWCESLVNCTVYLVASFGSEAVFNTNLVDKAPNADPWTDYDASGDTGGDTAIALMFEVPTGGSENWGARKNGSTDNREYDCDSHAGVIIGCDGGEVCEIANGDNVSFFWQGYIKDSANMTFNTNATDISRAAAGSWADLTALPAGADGGFIEIKSNNYNDIWGLRENGSAENIQGSSAGEQHAWGVVEADASRLIEGIVEKTTTDFFLTGYNSAAAGGVEHTATLNDEYDFADVLASVWLSTNSLSDSYDFADSISLDIASVLALNDSYDFSDAVSPALQYTDSLSDSYDFSDQLTGILQFVAALNDSYDFDDTVAVTMALSSSLSDEYDFADTLATIDKTQISLVSEYDFADSITGAQQFSIALNDEIDFADQITGILQFVATLTDEIDFADAVTPRVQFGITLSDDYDFADTVATIAKYVESLVNEYDFADTQVEIHVPSAGGQGLAWITVSAKQADITIVITRADMSAVAKIADLKGRSN